MGAVAGAVVGRAVAERHVEARADVVAERDRAQEGGAAAVLQLGDRERRRHDAAAGMEAAAQMRVVGLVGMAGHAVGERREFGRNHERGADDGRLRRAARSALT